MEVITIESRVYEELINRLERIEQYIMRSSMLLDEINDELEMTTKDVTDTLTISESTLYRWRKKNLLRYRYLESGEIRYYFKSLYISLKSQRLRISGMKAEEALKRLNSFKDNMIIRSCINSNSK